MQLIVLHVMVKIKTRRERGGGECWHCGVCNMSPATCIGYYSNHSFSSSLNEWILPGVESTNLFQHVS